MKKSLMLLPFFLVLVIGTVFAGGGQQSSAQAVKETAAPKLYQSNFTPSGTAANEYKDKINDFTANFIKSFTDRGEASKITGYDTPVKISISYPDSAAMQTSFAAWKALYGESPNMNRYLDVYKRAFNIDVSVKFTSTDYDQQLRLNMAANDLPDIFPVTSRNDLFELANAGVIQDIGGLRQKYSSQIVEKLWSDTASSSPLLDLATFDGKLYALPQTWPVTDPLSYLWIRSDWLKALNLQPPKTMDDLVKVIDAFTKADFDKNGINDTIGIGFQKNIASHNFRGLFSGFYTYPEYWINKNGSLIWGGTDENNKRALAYMSDLYKRGYIDKEFISYNDSDMYEAFLNGKCGIMYSWHGGVLSLMDLHSKDPKADFIAVPLPSVDGKTAASPITPFTVGYTVVNSKFANPEIAYKMFNLFVFLYEGKNGSWWGFNPPPGGNNANGMSAFARIYSPWLNYDAFESLTKSYKANWDRSLIDAAADLYLGPMQDSQTGWAWNQMLSPERTSTAFHRLKEIVDGKTYFYDAFLGIPSTYMQDRWQAILTEQQVIFTKIITGDLDVNTGFDSWIRSYNSLGGERITKEVNDWYKGQKK
ncbi:lipoprotein LipO [Spirochaetia bacterium]|nr:lipoprotein LipO [Spirochaetia bacterium]